jgi:hypothetical protein
MTTKKALADEAGNKEVTFEYNGVEYEIPPGKLWPLEAVEAQENGKMLTAVKELIGAEKYAELRKTAKTLEDFEEFCEALFDAVDLDKGK